MIFVAGDIGGTHSRLLLGESGDHGWRPLARADYPSDRFDTFDEVLRLFLEAERRQPEVMVLAVAGPVRQGRVRLTNRPWLLDADALRERFAIDRVSLLNDFEAMGHALPVLQPSDVVTLQAGQPEAQGVRALMGAGTGLGMAQVIPCGDHWRVVPGEGGHADFAPRNDRELALWQALRETAGRVSVESLLSGPGLERIYRSLCERAGECPTPLTAADISQAALADPNGRARQALRIFVQIYGAVAGNLALVDLPRGGLFIAGGIAPKILPLLQEEGFLDSFLDKAPMQDLLRNIPVHVVVNEAIGLLGAAEVAAHLA